MQSKKTLFLIAIIIISLCSAGLFARRLSLQQQKYQTKIMLHVEHLLAQQQKLLQRLAKQLTPYIKNHDLAGISEHLRMYEDQVFVFAKQGLTIPVHVQWATLNAPQKIVASNGLVTPPNLAPDEDFYQQIIADPQQIIISEPYSVMAMPEHNLVNLGLGIVENQQYLGHLEVSLALPAAQNYLNARIAKAKFFDFELKALEQPRIILKAKPILQGLIKYLILGLGGFIGGYWIVLYTYRFWRQNQQKNRDLQQQLQQVTNFKAEIAMLKHAAAVQNKYACLRNTATKMQMLDLQQILCDAQAVNAELAQTRGVHLKLPLELQLQIPGSQLHLMQIFAGILYTIIQQVPPGSTISIQVQAVDLQQDLRQFIIEFKDDGFYDCFTATQEPMSYADIRAKGWENILQLVQQQQGECEHVHTAYKGNRVTVSFTRKVKSNVVRLEEYLQDS